MEILFLSLDLTLTSVVFEFAGANVKEIATKYI